MLLFLALENVPYIVGINSTPAFALKSCRHCNMATASSSSFLWTDQFRPVQRVWVWRSQKNAWEWKFPFEGALLETFSQSQIMKRVTGRVWHKVVQSDLPYRVQACRLSDHHSHEPHCRWLFLLSSFLLLPKMLQSPLSGQVASIGMLGCVAKQNRCRKSWLKLGKRWRGKGGQGARRVGCVEVLGGVKQ